MKRHALILVFVSLCSLPCAADDAANVRTATAMTAAINARDLDALDEFIAPDVLRHSAATPDVVVTNLAEFKAFLETDFASVSDSVQKIDVIFGGDDHVAIRARYIGTQDGAMGPFPATGKRLELPYVVSNLIERLIQRFDQVFYVLKSDRNTNQAVDNTDPLALSFFYIRVRHGHWVCNQ